MLTKKLTDSHSAPSGQAFLYWKNGHCMEQKEVNRFLSIGRESANQLQINDHFVSRRHARIEKKPSAQTYILRDMGSQNGVFLNGSRIQQAVLKNNDHFQIGKTLFNFSFERYNYKWKITTQSFNPKWNKTLSRIPYLAASSAPILILGPSGSGKELIAQMIHNCSPRNAGRLVSINCSALTESLVESELFGHKKGSYTGSSGDRKGAFLTANKGTLFMDEIGDLPQAMQPKILRAVEYKEIKPLGSDLVFKTDARIISATHQNLKAKIDKNEFRQDLYFRLNVLSVTVPALKERMEDFEHLFQYFCLTAGVTVASEVIKILKGYHWPGNIRELKNMVERAKALFPGEIIDKEKALLVLDRLEEGAGRYEPLQILEKKSILKALDLSDGNQTQTARLLGISRSSLYDKIKKHNIPSDLYKKSLQQGEDEEEEFF